MHAKKAPSTAADATYRWSSPASEFDESPPPPWRVTNGADDEGDNGGPRNHVQHSLIIMTASNMHRAELLEAIAAWTNAEREPDAPPLKVLLKTK